MKIGGKFAQLEKSLYLCSPKSAKIIIKIPIGNEKNISTIKQKESQQTWLP